MSYHPIEPSSHVCQRGATTLLITVLILFLASLLVIAVSRTTTMEQRLSANEMRSRQAFEAAQAGFDHALTELVESGSTLDASITSRCLRADGDCSDPVAKPFPTYRFAYCDPPPDNNPGLSSDPCAVPGTLTCNGVSDPENYKKPLIVSCGWSDDQLGRRFIRQGFQTVPTLGNPSTVPFITKGSIGVQGSATLWNYYTNLNIWSGGPLTNIGNSGRTYVRDPNIAPPSESDPPPTPNKQTDCGAYKCYLEVTDKTTTGPDVIDNDPTLANLTDAQMFTLFTGAEDSAYYRDNIATMTIDLDDPAADLGDLDGLLGQAVYIDGDTTLPSNSTIGSRTRPVVLVIDGNMTGGGGPVVYGIVYVTGNLDVAGNITVYGGMVIEGTTGGTGSLDIVYDPFAVKNADENVGRSAPIPGDWRDWP